MGKINNKMKPTDIALIAMFTSIMAICSWISIPMAIPFTLQTFGVFVAVGVLGGRRGTLAVLVYLLLGLAGVPVFAGFSGGIGYLMGSTGGYIVGFLFSSVAMWITEFLLGRKGWALALSMTVGLSVCYALGTVWFMAVYTKSSGYRVVDCISLVCFALHSP